MSELTHLVEPLSTERELALLGLLDDPSSGVRGALMAEFERQGGRGVAFLQRILDRGDAAQRAAAKRYLRELGAEDTRGAFVEFIRSTRYELETGSILLDRTLHPRIDANDVCVFLDEVAMRVKQLLIRPSTVFEQCRVINRVIFHEYGFRGDRENFYHPHNCFLHKVIERRRGLPISLSIIYLLVAYRCGIELEPVGLPGRFMVGCFLGEEPFYVDVFEGGVFRDQQDLERILEHFKVKVDPGYFLPLPVGDVLLRCCRNLVNQFTRAQQPENARLFAGFVHEFESVYQQQD